MKRRTLKKKVKNLDALSTVIHNAADLEVAKQVMGSMLAKCNETDCKLKVVIREDPFHDKELNDIFSLLWWKINNIICKQ